MLIIKGQWSCLDRQQNINITRLPKIKNTTNTTAINIVWILNVFHVLLTVVSKHNHAKVTANFIV